MFPSTVNAETQKHFLNVWQPIYTMMFKSFCKRKGLKREVFAGDTIQKGDMFDKIDIVC